MTTSRDQWFRPGVLVAAVTVFFWVPEWSAAAADNPPGVQEFLMEDSDSIPGRLPPKWQAKAGSWQVQDSALVADGRGGMGLVSFGDPSWQNYELEATATFLEVAEDNAWLALVVRATPDAASSWSQFTLRQKTTRGNGVEFAVRREERWTIRQHFPLKKECLIGHPIQVRALVRNTTVQGFIDSQKVIDSPFCLECPTGQAGLALGGCRVKFDQVRLRRLPDTPAPPPWEPKPCEIVAHRGFSYAAPENTLASVRKAIEVGADGCEFDVHRTADGALMLMHDDDLRRTTNGSGKIAEFSLPELKKLDAGSWKGKSFAGQRVPTLEEALAALKDSGCLPVIEIKTQGISDKVVQALRQSGMLQQACVISFPADVVKEVHQREPKLRCAWLFGEMMEGTPAERAERLAQETKACGTDILDMNYHLASPELIQELKRRGIHVWVWTVDDPLLMRVLSAWGVDSITTNRPDLALKQLPRVTGK